MEANCSMAKKIVKRFARKNMEVPGLIQTYKSLSAAMEDDNSQLTKQVFSVSVEYLGNMQLQLVTSDKGIIYDEQED